MRPAPPGALFRDGGDIDNRLKTLVDTLRVPTEGEIPTSWTPGDDERPLHCLLKDDKLITAFGVETDRLLVPNSHEQDVFIMIHVAIKATARTWNNTDLAD
jgi:hypothetical protein